MSVLVLRAGMLTTVQDLGRHGHQHEGVPVGGAMDTRALRLANLLVGNAESAAGLEVTLVGPTLQFQSDVVFSIAGADLSATLDTRPVPLQRAVRAGAGAQLAFGERVTGCRAYIAFRGGIDVPMVLGSRSTYLRARLGGFMGRALAKEDVVGLCPSEAFIEGIIPMMAPRVAQEAMTIRAMRGHHFDLLSDEARAALLSADAHWFRIAPNSDRMGYRLDGPPLAWTHPVEMVSEPVAFGTVQLPPDGSPIILMADRQTTGGYPRVLEVATADLPLLAQAVPGTRIQFREISLEAAQRLYL